MPERAQTPASTPEARSSRDFRYFFRPRIIRIAPEIKARALEALLALISGAVTISATAKLATPTNNKNIPAALSIYLLLL